MRRRVPTAVCWAAGSSPPSITVSGVSHAPFRPLTKPVMQLPGNRLGYGAFMRALLVALFEWVERGTAPPDSRFPSRATATLVPLAEPRRTFPGLSK
jgi:hypothetical protein